MFRAQLQATTAQAAAARPARSSGRGRAVLAVILITLGVLLAPVAVIAAWTKSEVTDTDRFVATLTPLIEDEAFQVFLVDGIAAAVDDSIGIEAISADLLRNAAEHLVTSDAFERVWDRALRVSHAQLTTALSGDTSQAVVISESGELGIQLGPIIEEVKTELIGRGHTLAQRIPDIDRTIVVAEAEGLAQARTVHQILDVLGVVLPWLSLLLPAAGVLAARTRSRALVWAGIALALAMALLASGLSIGRILFVDAISRVYLPTDAAGSIYDALVPLVYSTAIAVGVVGVTVAIVAYFAGHSPGEIMARGPTVDTAGRLRAAAAAKGATTGKFGACVYRARRYLRIAVAVIAAAIVLFVRPLSPGVILWTATGALLAILLIEVLQRPSVEEAAVGIQVVGGHVVGGHVVGGHVVGSEVVGSEVVGEASGGV
ncbi:hypothetical protein BHD05_09705 [Marisediminicola antarctica]|uniref:Integral membrane protein n=1 Tax=Marisediminicola antarctica TaxID=674079 RepID=A0A7L5AKH5_9MICO|nr:hypothetical protein BHD05_09705 [Marisediminicola antarctica]